MDNNLKNLIDKYSTISFDIFDTLVVRNCYEPKDIFKIMAKIVKKEYGISDFYKLRIDCENKTRKLDNNYETNIDDIYDELNKHIKNSSITKKVKQLEIKIEKDFIVKNDYMYSVYDYCRKQNKNIIFISDMYLTKDIIKKILGPLGYDCSKLYVSCEAFCSKGSVKEKSLFKYVHDIENIDYKDWLHIGDNINADYNMPKNFGINAYHYKNVREQSEIDFEPSSISERIMRGIQNNYLYATNKKFTYWQKFGCLYASPIYYGFTNYIYQLTKDSNDTLYFLSRDAYIVKIIYAIIDKYNNTNKKTKYIYSSRATWVLPMMMDKEKENLINLIIALVYTNNNMLSLRKILTTLDLDVAKYENIINDFNIKSMDQKINFENHHNYVLFFKYIFEDVKTIFKERRKMLKLYLKQEGIADEKKPTIVDVGWNGSSQHYLSEVLDKETFAYYFGTVYSHYYDVRTNSIGYAFDMGSPNDLLYTIHVDPKIMMYEFLFTAPHGTAKKYVKEKGKIVPILGKTESYIKEVNIFQESAIDIINIYLKYSDYIGNVTAKEIIPNYECFINKHDYDDMYMFSKLTNSISIIDSQTPYVFTYSKEYLLKNFDLNNHLKLYSISYNALWGNSFVIKGIKTKEEYNEFMKKLEFNSVRSDKIFTYTNMIKFLKNPQKGFNILRIIINKKIKK